VRMGMADIRRSVVNHLAGPRECGKIRFHPCAIPFPPVEGDVDLVSNVMVIGGRRCSGPKDQQSQAATSSLAKWPAGAWPNTSQPAVFFPGMPSPKSETL